MTYLGRNQAVGTQLTAVRVRPVPVLRTSAKRSFKAISVESRITRRLRSIDIPFDHFDLSIVKLAHCSFG